MKKMQPDWIAVDWGTSHLRAWAMTSAGEILGSAESDSGMGKLAPHEFETELNAIVSPWLESGGNSESLPVICCGMVGAKQGWVEVPYATVPCQPAADLTRVETARSWMPVWICPGVKQSSPADVMRGEETQIAGLLAKRSDFEGVVCLPGTHSKWASVGGGEIRNFRTFMTGELFALLASESVLRHTVADSGWDESAFLEAVAESFASPATVSSRLFSLRAGALLDGLGDVAARSRLSGFLIGLEFSGARDFWNDQEEVTIIGADRLSENYQTALSAIGVVSKMEPTDEMTVAGLYSAFLKM